MPGSRSQSLRLLACTTALLPFAGCATLPPQALEHDVRTLAGPQVAAETAWRRSAAEDAAVAERVAALVHGGFTVDRAVAIAVLANPDLQQRFEALGIARAAYLSATRPPNPLLTASARAVRGGSGEDLQWGFLEDLVALLTLPARAGAARATLDAARLETADAVVELAAQTRVAAWRVLGAAQERALRAQCAEVAGLRRELAARFRLAGNTTLIDEEHEREAWLAARRALGESELGFARARETLARLLGMAALPADWALVGELPPVPAQDPPADALLADALARRLDLQAAKRVVDARVARLGGARAARFTPALAAGVGSEAFPGGARVVGPQLSLELPLFSSGETAVAAADGEARLAMRHAQALALDVARDLRLAYASVREARQRHADWADDVVPLRQAVFEDEQSRAFFMLAGTVEPLGAKQRLLEAQASAVAALTDYWTARVALARAAGDLAALGGNTP